MPMLTRARKKAHEEANALQQSKSNSPKYTKQGNKRKLSHAKTPPNKKKKKTKNMTPSKQLAKCVSRLQLKYEYEYGTDNDSDYKEEFDEDRNIKIQRLQKRLLTQESKNRLIGRSKEYDAIHSFICRQLDLMEGNSYYLCGSPGTGKTATITMIMDYFLRNKDSKCVENIIKINGMSLNNGHAIYSVLYNKIKKNKEHKISETNAKNKLSKYLMNKKWNKMYIVIIDEMDGLLDDNMNQEPLYDLFRWTKMKNCKLILIGIANSIDLMDRFLPRLKERNIDPELLIFKPYTKSELMDIVKYRLSDDYNTYFEDIALKLCAQKVAKMYGDIRKLLEIVRNALNFLMQNEEIEKIGFIEMKRILSDCFSSPLIDIITSLPNQQKTVLLISCLLMNKRNSKYIIYNKLQSFYQFVAKKYILQKISSREFSIIIDSLISDHILKIVSNKKKIFIENDTKLQITPKMQDVQFALKNDTVLNKFFENDMIIPHKFIK